MTEPAAQAVAIGPAVTDADRTDFAALVREYVGWLAIDLGYQGLEAELAALERVYGEPGGILLARGADGTALGGVAVKPLPALGSGICEMKRLYVRPAGRGLGLGRRLAEAAMAHGRSAGFSAMVLDTLPSRMGDAVAMYARLGFTPRAAYYDTPITETIFLERLL
ncbi:GNAT family N-acetyltransferase [Thalassobaculum sp. OXR-137]|uniref:GNAT family N-acetyltransferase n=1 Tax=Thalassobaculum sp. OXR-137 TaxID=3100173 RepID=UPI002AC91ECE|nr:GNAT family N-acetyltransferase [Thalassobaculum sp. OXR-137]WPZ35713.1 GNAT family N-acetyltransferase [Thalassobaculum sp. OXR-137]